MKNNEQAKALTDEPYPGMAAAFESHFGQSWTDKQWRTEAATWAAAWKRALLASQPSEPADVPQKNGDLIDWDRISEAAKQACNEYGQWMPERWLQLFVNAYNRKKS